MDRLNTFFETAKKTRTEAKWWSYAAWTLPFVALAAIIFEHFIGHSDWVEKTIWATTVIFFSVSVFWWWWALNKFVTVLESMKRTNENFEEIKNAIKESKQTLVEIDASNRKWRESLKSKSKQTTRSKSRM